MISNNREEYLKRIWQVMLTKNQTPITEEHKHKRKILQKWLEKFPVEFQHLHPEFCAVFFQGDLYRVYYLIVIYRWGLSICCWLLLENLNIYTILGALLPVSYTCHSPFTHLRFEKYANLISFKYITEN